MPTFHHFELRQLKPAYDKSWALQSTPPINLLYIQCYTFLNGGKSTPFPLVPQAPNINQSYYITRLGMYSKYPSKRNLNNYPHISILNRG